MPGPESTGTQGRRDYLLFTHACSSAAARAAGLNYKRGPGTPDKRGETCPEIPQPKTVRESPAKVEKRTEFLLNVIGLSFAGDFFMFISYTCGLSKSRGKFLFFPRPLGRQV